MIPFSKRPFGVNLIGHAFEIFGVGEDIRMAARALQEAEVPCCVIHHPASNGSACNDSTLEHLICSDLAGGPYAFNLVCMAAPIQYRWLRQVGCDPLRERYTISSWPWETKRWPDAWLPLLNFVDELWPASQFTSAALSDPAFEAGLPIHVMPMAAEIIEPDRFCNPSARAATRCRYDVPTDTVLFGFSFDLNSTAIRKNPMGALDVFQRAFPLPHQAAMFGRECNTHPLAERVSLLIKTFPLRGFNAAWEWLQARAAEDPRIVLVADTLSRDDLLSLYACFDVFLSLHRSEGFGRCIAEAFQLGLDVIATDFGGNTDFCNGPLSHPVRYQEISIPKGSYPYAEGHHWADPDLGHAAGLCQQLAEQRLAINSNKHVYDFYNQKLILDEYKKRFSFATVGSRYRKRLEELWGQRHSLHSNFISK